MADVTIRPITYDDTDNIIKWRNSDYVRSHFIDQRLFTKESHEYWLRNMVETGKVAQFIILLDGTPVGSVYLRDIDYEKLRKAIVAREFATSFIVPTFSNVGNTANANAANPEQLLRIARRYGINVEKYRINDKNKK